MSCQITAPIHYITFNLLNLNSGNLLNFFHLKFIAVAVYFAFLGRIHKRSDMIKGTHTHTNTPVNHPPNATNKHHTKKGVCVSHWMLHRFHIFLIIILVNLLFFFLVSSYSTFFFVHVVCRFPSIHYITFVLFTEYREMSAVIMMMHSLCISFFFFENTLDGGRSVDKDSRFLSLFFCTFLCERPAGKS